jgi:hypothetical protein
LVHESRKWQYSLALCPSFGPIYLARFCQPINGLNGRAFKQQRNVYSLRWKCNLNFANLNYVCRNDFGTDGESNILFVKFSLDLPKNGLYARCWDLAALPFTNFCVDEIWLAIGARTTNSAKVLPCMLSDHSNQGERLGSKLCM